MDFAIFCAGALGWLWVSSRRAGHALAEAPSTNESRLATLHRSSARLYLLRLRPGADLLAELRAVTTAAGLRSAVVVTCVGSLTRAELRYANVSGTAVSEGHFEICSLVGTLSPDGPHLHISCADGSGHMFGGHVLDGCRVYTTAEIVLAEAEDLVFSRPVDPETTWDELAFDRRR